LKIILDKLVNNAIKFTKIGVIEIGYDIVKKTDTINEFVFYVKDTGIGIPKDFHKIIFERFRQVEETNTRNYEGSGLGVTIAYKLVRLLGGRMWLESELEKGSTFYFSLPLEIKKAKINKTTPKPPKKAVPDYSSKRILIAEDTESNFKLLEQYLKRTKIEIIWAVDGVEAVEFCKQNESIDLILMDMKMPNMNGYEATIEIKKLGVKCPVIAQTAYALQDDEVKTFTAGCDDYLSKPIKSRDLYNCMDKYIN
jgi:CheY-like chemotaxis protein